jgi:hypothetical protein
MWRNCGNWQTGTFEGFPELSQQSFAHVYEHAPVELLAWVRSEGPLTGIRWLFDLAAYVRMRATAEGRDVFTRAPLPEHRNERLAAQ